MTHHMNDAFGNEAPRPQDAVPIDEAGRLPAESDMDQPTGQADNAAESLQGLAGVAPAGGTSSTGERTRARRRPRRSSEPVGGEASTGGAASEPSAPGSTGAGDELNDLEAQGFTPDEARRLIDITARLEQSAEAREAEATRRRLHFTRWLLDHGRLDEWSA